MITVMWFRKDLRLIDNTALFHLIKNEHAGKVLFLFHVNPEQFLNDSFNHQAFFASVHHFYQELKKQHITLQILYGDLLEKFAELKSSCPDWQKVYFNADERGFGKQRDDKAVHFFKSQKIDVHTYQDSHLHGTKEICNQAHEPYKVFTPYYKKWLDQPKPVPLTYELRKEQIETKQLFAADTEKFINLAKENVLPFAYHCGSLAAGKRLDEFIEIELESYAHNRDLPAIDGTSRMSAYLRTGEISPRTISAKLHSMPASEGKNTYIKELCWRDFYNMVYSAYPKQKEQPIDQKFSHLEWRQAQEDLEKWKAGMTGYPLIDAAMRQLKTTGWMHNRLRMITASFLTKDLLIDWRLGEKYFQKMLIDYDPASNIGGWQWAASTGMDAVPFFRIFNPVSQSKQYDRQGAFIKKFIPELRQVPTTFIHEPIKMTEEVPIKMGTDYPFPIVDHAEARKRALHAYELSKELAREQHPMD